MKIFFMVFMAAALILVNSCGKSTDAPVDDTAQLSLLTKVKLSVDSNVTYMFNLLYSSSTKITADTSQSNIRTILSGWFNNIKNLEEGAFIDESGKLKYIEPAFYRNLYEGTDISTLPQFVKVKSTKQAVMSGYFKSTGGYNAIDIEFPVVNSTGGFYGALSMKFKPTLLLGFIIENITKQDVDDFMLIQTDGTIFYDTDNNILKLTGKNLLTDAEFQNYADFKAAAAKITSTADGKATFNYLDKTGKNSVKKTVWWTTLTYYKTEWKLCLVKE